MAYPYWIGSQKDLQSRRAIVATTTGESHAGIIPQLIGKDQFPPGDVHANNPFNPPNAAQALRAKQALIARAANTPGEYGGVLPQLLGKDVLPNGVGGQVQRDQPNPSFAVVLQQSRTARIATDVSQYDTPLPSFIGTDKFYDGAGKAPSFEYPNPSFVVVARQALVASRADDVGQYDQPLPLLGIAAPLPPGASCCDGCGTTLTPPNTAAQLRLRAGYLAAVACDMGVGWDRFDLQLIGQDQFNPGEQSFDLPPLSAARARDYSFTASYFQGLIGQDALPSGKQSFVLPTPASARARDYSFTASFFQGLIGQDALPTGAQTFTLPTPAPARARDYSVAASFPLELLGQDALAPGEQSVDLPPRAPARAATLFEPGVNLTLSLSLVPGPQGAQSFDLAPRAALRAREYGQTASYALELIGRDALPNGVGGQVQGDWPNPSFAVVGQQNREARLAADLGQIDGPLALLVSLDAFYDGQGRAPNFDWQLPPRGAQRASTLGEPGFNFTLELAAIPQIGAGQSTALTALGYPTPPARLRDYTFVGSYTLELIGKDALNAGRASLDEQYRSQPRARDYTIATSFPLTLIGKDIFPNGAGGQVQDDWQLPPHAAPRSFALYDPGVNLTVLAPTPSIPVGEQIFDLPTPAVLRARDYSFTATFFHGLDGKDALPSGHSTANTDLPPKAAARARDYTWLQTAPLYVYQQLPPGASTESSVVPPRGPARSRDYTFLRSLPVHLIGQDTLYGAPGEVPAYDWQLPPRAASRLRDYTLVITAPYGSGIPPRDLIYVIGTPGSAWIVGASPPSSHWLAGLPSQ